MSDYLSGISSVSASSSVQGSGSSKKPLSEETKKKLEAYHIDTSKIKTEDEGQKKLKEIQATQQTQETQKAQSAQQNHGAQGQQQNGAMATIMANVKDLASQVGVSVGVTSDIETVFANMQKKITEMKNTTVSSVSEDQKAMASSYQTRYESLYREYENTKKSQSMITTSLNVLASYNMAML